MGYVDTYLMWQRERQREEERRLYGPRGRPPIPSGYAAPLNRTSIVAFGAAFFIPLVAVICGVLSLVQIARTGERGRMLAVIALVLGLIGSVFWIAVLVDMGAFTSPYRL